MGILGEPSRVSTHTDKSALKEIRYGYVSRVSSSAWLPSGEPLTAEIEVEGPTNLLLSIDNDKAADWYGMRVRVTVEVVEDNR